jgi:hypothetical protein
MHRLFFSGISHRFTLIAGGSAASILLSGCVLLLPFVEPYHEPQSPSSSYDPAQYPASSARRHVPRSELWLRYYRKQLADPSPQKRTAAASYLGFMGAQAAPAVPDLAARLSDESKFVRRAAAKALGKIGPAAATALPDLKHACRDTDPFVRRSAETALRQVRSRE